MICGLRGRRCIKVQDNDLRLAPACLGASPFAAKKNKTPSEVLAAQAGGGYA